MLILEVRLDYTSFLKLPSPFVEQVRDIKPDGSVFSSYNIPSSDELVSFKRQFAQSVEKARLATEDSCICWNFKLTSLVEGLKACKRDRFTISGP